jgi:hypothetical protein
MYTIKWPRGTYYIHYSVNPSLNTTEWVITLDDLNELKHLKMCCSYWYQSRVIFNAAIWDVPTFRVILKPVQVCMQWILGYFIEYRI